MSKEKSFMDLSLSELVDGSLAKGLVPIFKFFDKDKVAISEDEYKSTPLMEETPVTILEKQVRHYNRMISRIEKREDIVSMADGAEEKLAKLVNDLKNKVALFEKAINDLNKFP